MHAVPRSSPWRPADRSGRDEHAEHEELALAPLARALHLVSEYDTVDGKKVPVWLAANDDRPLRAFGVIWTEWTSTRRKAEGEITTDA